MTKNQYIDFIRNSLPAEDETDRFHPNQVAYALNSAINTVFYEMYKKQPKVMAKSLDRYTTFVLDNPERARPPAFPAEATNRYITPLDVDVVDLPRKASGIIEIFLEDSTYSTTKFVPISSIEGAQLIGSESSLPDNIAGFTYLATTRYIEYWNLSAADAATGVIIRFIQQFKDYSGTDNIILPYGQDERVIELVRQYLGVIPPKDLINDNADTNG